MRQHSKIEFSIYNILVELEDGSQGLLYNGVSGELIRLKNRLYGAFKEGNVSKILPGERSFLKRKGILCSDGTQQKEDLERRFQAMKTPSDSSTFVFTSTLHCNLNCHYCYETHARIEKRTMSREMAERAVKFIERAMSPASKKRATVKFYGGEPLLAYDVCKYAANTIKAALTKMGKQLVTWIQTNGVLIEEEMLVNPLPDLACMEITLDGSQRNHDQIRVNQAQKPTYEKIIANIHRLAQHDIPVLLRINAHSGQEMIDALADLEQRDIHKIKHLVFYDGQVADSFYDHNIKGVDCLGHLENEEQLKIIHDIRTHVRKTEWANRYQMFPLFQKNAGICSFAQEGNFCIDPLGDLYSCLFQIGNPYYKIGKIAESGQPDFLPIYQKILERNPFDDEGCQVCEYLSQCWGGCYVKSYAREGSVSKPFCGNLKKAFPFILKSTLWEKAYENVKI